MPYSCYTTSEIDTISGSLSVEIDSDISTHASSADHDGRYYTEAEVDALTWLESDITDLDKYTQAETDTLLAGKSDTNHNHTLLDLTDTPTIYDENKFLKSTTSGTEWSGAASLAGSDKEIQFNDNGEFGADSDFTWDKTAKELKLYGDVKTDRWLNHNSNTFFGIDVVGSGSLSGQSYENTAFGNQTLCSITSGKHNTVVGYLSAYSNTTGLGNTAIGRHALYSNSKGSWSTAVGYNALYSQIGTDLNPVTNVGIGCEALYWNEYGNRNVAVGDWALNKKTTGDANTAVGHYALCYNTIGESNTAVGRNALANNIEGNNNVAIGEQAGFGGPGGGSSGSNGVFIGYHAGYAETGSNRLYISNSNTSTPLIYGEFDNDFLRINGDLDVIGNLTVSGTSPGGAGGASTLLELTDTPSAYDNTKYLQSTTSGIEWGSGSAGMADLVDDTSPQLGGDLYTNGNDILFDADTISGTGTIVTGDHGTATDPEVVNVIYGTGDAPTASGVPIGTLYIKYI